ncbi:tRNA (adenosine(37)-N6)-threonylcarbamoyltransferase complex dimerization subunit type 1 TsaB [Listeria weihenstephanensis]|uniref:tRNA (Adenosine(37)-N6)-threonylcarbamoyltransferase complex dimerization subunit type 1 TsaB n=1 Tax=Listeria weihenstephanensis TaxID=1006155 RepID=A0A841Z4U4_9LIST|nr:tRNA (adenosine(37)-N6)-threonylcarbamoyltransferase complex dimerization subunit type 1 TsaB [Listeria weihenstephanensis]MBC1499336.1 tRNA (adenosine(37)-N6)-threonylcarbamoyltransferase complex dimerization subunit type 1 TsaB [Listeria weihenstephanensis]
MTILGIDTSNDTLGVSLWRDEKVIGELVTNLKKNHSVRLLPAIAELMKECDTTPQDLMKIAVAEGPGSYTGLRIGVTVAKTMAWDLQIPLVGISSLTLMAQNGRFFDGLVVPVMDARRGNVYAGIYKSEAQRLDIFEPDQHLAFADLLKKLDAESNILFIGDGAVNFKEEITAKLGARATIADAALCYPRPAFLGELANPKEGVPAHTFVPTYLKLAEAESKWLEANKHE